MPCKPTKFSNGIEVGGCFNILPDAQTNSGWGNYEDNQASLINVPADTWTQLTSNGLGAATITTYLPLNVTQLWDTSTNELDLSEVAVGAQAGIRGDFFVYPTQNNTNIDLRLRFVGTGFDFDLRKRLARLDEGADDESLGNDLYKLIEDISFFVGSTNVQQAAITYEIKTSSESNVKMNGFYVRAS